MAKLLSAHTPVRFVPPGQGLLDDSGAEADPIAYLVEVPTILTRARFRHAVRAHGARAWAPADLSAQLRDEVAELMAAPEDLSARDRAMSMIDAFDAAFAGALDSGADIVPDEDMASILRGYEDVVTAVESAGGRYARMKADNALWSEIATFEAVRHFLVAAENIDLPAARRADGTWPPAVLESLPADHFAALGGFIMTLFSPSRDEEKNSDSPSDGVSARPTSTARKMPRKKAR